MAKHDMTIELDEKDYQKMLSILRGMSEVDQAAAIQYALKQGMQVIVNAGKSNLSSRNNVVSGNLKRSFSIKANKKKGFALGGFKRSTKYNKIGGGNHSYLVSDGTAERYTRKGYYRGSVSKGNPNHGSRFWRDAVESQGPAALSKLMDAVYQAVDDIMRKKG